MNTQGVEDIYELSPLQQGMLFHTLYEPESKLYLEQMLVPLAAAIDTAAFERAWNWLAEEHTALRTSFHWEDIEKPVQVVHRKASVPTDVRDLRGLTREQFEAEVRRLLEEDRQRGFDMAKPPLLRITLLQSGTNECALLLSFHHLILDGWSLQVVFRQFLESYTALAQGLTPRSSRSRPYGEYIRWLQKSDAKAAQRYWQSAFAGYDGSCRLPLDETNDSGFAEYELSLPAAATARLKEFGARNTLTMNTIVQGAWALLLRRMTGSDDVVFGVIASGRPADLPDVENIVGLFINTVALRKKVEGGASVVRWLQSLQQEQFAARQFDHTPLVQAREWSAIPGRGPLFDTLFAFENYPVLVSGDGGTGNTTATVVERTNYPLSAVIVPAQTEVQVRLLYNKAALHAETVRNLGQRFLFILESFAAAPSSHIDELPSLTPEDRALFDAVNETRTGYPSSATIASLWHEQVMIRPGAIAVEHGHDKLTYLQLDLRATIVAGSLAAQGVKPGEPVAIRFERSIDCIVAMLGIIKAGAVYVPIDIAFPPARVEMIMEDTGARVMLTSVPAFTTAAAPDVLVTADDPAHIIYTSGSTGVPKGVIIPHRGVVRLVRDTNYLRLGPDDCVAHMSNVAFDAATFEIWSALLNGARLVLIGKDVALSPHALVRELHEHGVNVFFITTALFNQVVAEIPDAFSTLRCVMFGAEAADARFVRDVLEAGPPRELLHMYGPTESTTYATWHRVTAVPPGATTVPIGKPVANTTAYVLDAALSPVPPGGTGELFIGGDGLASGYHRRPSLTAERFLPDPFSPVPGARMYRTGDKVRWSGDGSLTFAGRFDQQVKLRGYRIELQEIESRLLENPNVRQAVVVVHDDRLAAYVVLRDGAASDWQNALRQSLRKHLPDYMQPSALERLDALPVNTNGKIDYAALPAPRQSRPELDAELVAPRTDTERKLAAIWQQLLGIDRVGVHDVFLDIGGHSLRATQLVSRIRRTFGVELPLRAVFEKPTIDELAHLLDESKSAAPTADVPQIPRLSRDKYRVSTS